jgi:cytochrome c peroxidase
MRKSAALLVSVLLVSGCDETVTPPIQTSVAFTKAEIERIFTLSPLPAPPKSPTNRYADDPAAAHLGQQLFFDKRLSANGAVSCATCHDPSKGFGDGRPRARGLADVKRHAPALWNVAYADWLFWDGRADSVWSQALGPLEAAVEMGSSRVGLWRLVVGDAELRMAYESIFGELPVLETRETLAAHGKPGDASWDALPAGDRAKIDKLFANLGKAIEAYERKLISRESPFDEFVRGLRTGDQALVDKLPAKAQRGLKLFLGEGQCTLCHHGPNFTDGEFHNLGMITPKGEDVDVGRYDGVVSVKANPFNGFGVHSDDTSEAANMRLSFVTKKLNNMGEFKTPTLRSVELSPPYMHDGRFGSLGDVLDFYRKMDGKPAVGHREESLQPLSLNGEQMGDLIRFLKSLTGRPIPAELLTPLSK